LLCADITMSELEKKQKGQQEFDLIFLLIEQSCLPARAIQRRLALNDTLTRH